MTGFADSLPVAWRETLTIEDVVARLRGLVRVAGADAHHDFSTALNTYNGEPRYRGGLPPLSVADCLQLAHVVRSSIEPDTEHEPGVWRGDLRFLNQHLSLCRAGCDNAETARCILPSQLQAAVEFVESGGLPYANVVEACSC